MTCIIIILRTQIRQETRMELALRMQGKLDLGAGFSNTQIHASNFRFLSGTWFRRSTFLRVLSFLVD